MKERPILFNTEMVRAILEGRKTQTRQIVKPNKWAAKYWVEAEQLISAGTHYLEFDYKTVSHKRAERENRFVVQKEQVKAGTTAQIIAMAKDTLLNTDYSGPPIDCPFGQIGDLFWVKEPWSTHSLFDDIESKYLESSSIHYWADGSCKTGKKRSASQMPQWASRITLEITQIRIERLNDISESDAVSEGMVADHEYCAEEHFMMHWTKMNGWKEKGWNANPLVWVIEFKVIDGLLENRDLIKLGG